MENILLSQALHSMNNTILEIKNNPPDVNYSNETVFAYQTEQNDLVNPYENCIDRDDCNDYDDCEGYNYSTSFNADVLALKTELQNIKDTYFSKNNSNPIICWSCNQPGHIQRYCTSHNIGNYHLRENYANEYCENENIAYDNGQYDKENTCATEPINSLNEFDLENENTNRINNDGEYYDHNSNQETMENICHAIPINVIDVVNMPYTKPIERNDDITEFLGDSYANLDSGAGTRCDKLLCLVSYYNHKIYEKDIRISELENVIKMQNKEFAAQIDKNTPFKSNMGIDNAINFTNPGTRKRARSNPDFCVMATTSDYHVYDNKNMEDKGLTKTENIIKIQNNAIIENIETLLPTNTQIYIKNVRMQSYETRMQLYKTSCMKPEYKSHQNEAEKSSNINLIPCQINYFRFFYLLLVYAIFAFALKMIDVKFTKTKRRIVRWSTGNRKCDTFDYTPRRKIFLVPKDDISNKIKNMENERLSILIQSMTNHRNHFLKFLNIKNSQNLEREI